MKNYFSINTKDIKYPDTFEEKDRTLAEGYDYFAWKDVEVPEEVRIKWEKLNGRSWDIRPNSYMMFIFYGDELASNFYVTQCDDVGTYHSARTSERHRKKGFYKYLVFRGTEILLNQELIRLEIETGQKHLWPFWVRLGFKRVENIHRIAKSFR